MSNIHKILLNNRIPIDVIIYLYQFDNTYKNKYSDCIRELDILLLEYNERYSFCRKVVINAIQGDEAFYPYSTECFEWAKTYGLDYNPSSFILKKNMENDLDTAS